MRELKITQTITNKERRSVEKYFNDLGRLEMLTPQEEVMMAQKIRQGDKAALDRLVMANLRFVVSVAKKYQNMGMSLEDLINEGNLGLIKAAQRFDETRGFKFISFAVWWIRQSILHALGEHRRMVRLPMNHINLLTRIGQNMCELETRLERQPTNEELAEFLGLEPQKIWDARHYSGHTISYDTPITTEDEYALIDVLAGDEPDTDHLLVGLPGQDQADELLAVLTPEEREVIEYRFGFRGGREMSNREVAQALGRYPEMIRLIAKRALQKLKNEVNTDCGS